MIESITHNNITAYDNPFLKACKQNDITTLRQLIQRNWTLVLNTSHFQTACSFGYLEIVKAMLIRVDEINQQIAEYKAKTSGLTTEDIVKNCGPTIIIDRASGIYSACQSGRFEVFMFLVELLENESIKWSRSTALRCACYSKKGLEIVKYLCEKCETETETNWFRVCYGPLLNNALVEVCSHGHEEIAEYLISKGAYYINTGFCEACTCGHINLVSLLISSYGANNFDKGLKSAVDGYYSHLADNGKILKIIKMLCERGANFYEPPVWTRLSFNEALEVSNEFNLNFNQVFEKQYKKEYQEYAARIRVVLTDIVPSELVSITSQYFEPIYYVNPPYDPDELVEHYDSSWYDSDEEPDE
jgi:hypothetical protein